MIIDVYIYIYTYIAHCSRYHLFGELMSELEAALLYVLEALPVVPISGYFHVCRKGIWCGREVYIYIYMYMDLGGIRTSSRSTHHFISFGSLGSAFIIHSPARKRLNCRRSWSPLLPKAWCRPDLELGTCIPDPLYHSEQFSLGLQVCGSMQLDRRRHLYPESDHCRPCKI